MSPEYPGFGELSYDFGGEGIAKVFVVLNGAAGISVP